MEYFAHIFIGKEFAEIVSKTGIQICKYSGEDILSFVNLFVVDDANIRQLLYSELQITVKDVIQQGGALHMDWQEIGYLTGNFDNDGEIFLRDIFQRILRVDNVGNRASLYIIIHFPLYKEEAFVSAMSLYKAIRLSGCPVELDFMGYSDDMRPVIEQDYEIASHSKNQVQKFIEFRNTEVIGYNTRFIVIQNASNNGLPLGLDADSLAIILSHFTILCANYYHEIFPKTMAYRDAVAMGISTLHLDKYLYTEYLLGKTLLNAMDNVQLNDNMVDSNKAYVIVNDMLKDKATLLSTLFKQIDEQVIHNVDEEFQRVQAQINNEIDKIENSCDATLSQEKALTMQAAILAVCLAKTDCELFSETIFSHDIVNIDKLFDETIDYYINNDRADYYKIADDKPINPIKQIKETDYQLINSETTLRALKNELGILKKQIGDSEKVSEFYIEGGYVLFENKRFKLLPTTEQEPLVETYTAHEVRVSSLDMRGKFSSVKNQGQQGSCLSFALTSIFEYVMQLNSNQECDLSEAFLYYNARNIDEGSNGNDDSGSRFKPSIDSLVEYGIAMEKIWPYNDQIYNQRPNEEAYKDAATRKLVSAMNVNLKVDDIKSALVDNCPVAASFTLTTSFFEYGNKGGYISMPSDEEIAYCLNKKTNNNRHCCHAMVIVGFSDELQMFIVRNSWGEDWGDKGYCYIPYSYIEHKDLFNYACILTEIENLVVRPDDLRVVPLTIDNSDLNIQYAIKNVELYKEEHIVEQLRKKKDELRIYFESLKQKYCNPNLRDEFVEANVGQLTTEQNLLKEEILQKNKEHDINDEKLNNYKKDILFRFMAFLLGTALFALVYKLFVDILHLKLTNPDFTFTLKPFLLWILIYAGFGIVSYILRKKSFVKSFWMALWGVAGVVTVKVISRLFCYLFGSDMLISYFKLGDIFPKISGVQVLWLIAVIVVALLVFAWKAHVVWKDWRDEQDRIDFEIAELNKEIGKKEKEKGLLKLKTFAAWMLITKLQNLQTKYYSHYTNHLSLINNLRLWYKELQNNEDNLSLKSKFPYNSLLSSKLLDDFFEKHLKNDLKLLIDVGANINQYEISARSFSEYKETLIQKVIDELLACNEIQDFNISNHIANNAFSAIALEVDREMMQSINEQSRIFLRISSTERGIIEPLKVIFAPSLAQYRDTMLRKMGNQYAGSYFVESTDRYRLTFLKIATVNFSECVDFKDLN